MLLCVVFPNHPEHNSGSSAYSQLPGDQRSDNVITFSEPAPLINVGDSLYSSLYGCKQCAPASKSTEARFPVLVEDRNVVSGCNKMGLICRESLRCCCT